MVLLLSLTLLKLCSIVLSESHYEDIYFVQTLSRQVCNVNYEEVCGGWWTAYDCGPVAKHTCTVEYYTSIGVTKRCQAGWQPYPGNCDIPICNPPCAGEKACINPNVCGCLATSGGLCSIVPCTSENNCYPGTCDNTGNGCTCPPVFTEQNCIRIVQLPDIRSCKVQLYDESSALTKQVDCASPGVEPQVTWIHNSALGKIQVQWEAHYVNPIGMPDATYAPHVKNAPVPLGVRQASFNVSFSGGAGTDLRTSCTIDQNQIPPSIVQCNEERQWSDYAVTPGHNQTFNVSAGAQLGGYKEGSSKSDVAGSFFPPTEYAGDAVYRHVQFKFDLQPPTHCLTYHGSADCLQFAIFLDQDIRTNPTIEPKIYNWTDDGSGLANYHIEVYYMQPSPPKNTLENVGGPLIQSNVTPSQNNFIYICTTPGVYSIELTVEDQAGNKAMARELFIYNDNAELTTDVNKPVYIKEANPDSKYNWITYVEYPQGGYIELTLIWTDHFKSAAEFNGNWGLAAEPWPTDRIDDRYEKAYGGRTIHAITDMPNGIIGYSVAFTVDQANGGRGLQPDNWTSVEATKDRYALSVENLVDGNALVVWLRCYDVAGSVVTEKQVVNVDTTKPEITEESFVLKSIDDYTSSVYLTIVDKAAGIKNISFEIYDRTLKKSVYTGSALPRMRDPAPSSKTATGRALEQPCTTNDTTCYCIPHGECYNYVQQVDIDHCWIDLLAGDVFDFKYTVENLATLKSTEQTLELGQLSDIPCRPSPGLSGGEIAGIVIGCLIGVLLIVILVFLIRIYVFKKPMPSRLAAAQRTLRNKFGPAKLDENIIYQTSGDIEPQQNNQSKSKENSKSPNKADIYAYSWSEDDGATLSGNSENDVIPRKQLEMTETLSEGSFATIRKVFFLRGNETITAAAKFLRNCYTEEDVKLLNRKIHFFSKLLPHFNIVKYLGRVEQNTQEGPILLMEFCEMSLKDWLKNNKDIAPEVLENMLCFTYDIAKGVQHLHENKIIHRRLAVRNVLLKEQNGGFVAKLIGFGPSKEDIADKSEQVFVPIKWLAPETLETMNSQSTIYNEKTDVWSFGIAVWEIYSDGASPYPDKKSSEVQQLVKKGLTLDCPFECPQDLFESVVSPCWNFNPNKRPTFLTICSAINRFRNGAEPSGYYCPSDETSAAGYYDPSQMYADQS